MKLLLDTHSVIWFANDDRRLSHKARRAIADPRNDKLFSVVSAWEIIAKAERGLGFNTDAETFIDSQLEHYGYIVTELRLPHVVRLRLLPRLHSDLFDRLLVTQALEERAAIVTSDRKIAQYDVKVVW